jgi:hypothetical protein
LNAWMTQVADAGVALFQQLAMPAQDGIRTHKESQSAQDLAGHRCQERGQEGVIRGRELHLVVAKLPFKNGDLVTQGKDLGVLVSIPHQQLNILGQIRADQHCQQPEQAPHQPAGKRRQPPAMGAAATLIKQQNPSSQYESVFPSGTGWPPVMFLPSPAFST